MENSILPIEILEGISIFIDHPKDFLSVILLCRETSHLQKYMPYTFYRSVACRKLFMGAASFEKFVKGLTQTKIQGTHGDHSKLFCWWVCKNADIQNDPPKYIRDIADTLK
jgi:hypothetical protein